MEKKPLLTGLFIAIFLFAHTGLADVNGPLRTSQEQITLLIEAYKTMALVDTDDFTAASAAIEKMKVGFADNAELPRWLYKIAYEYEIAGALEQAKSLNTQVVAGFQNSVYRTNAELQIAKLKIYELIDAGDYKAADSAISQIPISTMMKICQEDSGRLQTDSTRTRHTSRLKHYAVVLPPIIPKMVIPDMHRCFWQGIWRMI